MLNCKCRYSLYMLKKKHDKVCTDFDLTRNIVFKFSLFLLLFPTLTCYCHQDGSKWCKPTQCLYAAHAGTPTCEEPLPGALCAQGPLSKWHTTWAHHVFWCGPQETTKGRSHVEAVESGCSSTNPCTFCDVLMFFIQVIFDGEEAVDAGGVTKEFFLLLLKELMDPVYGMFTHYKDSNLLWFSDKVSEWNLL